MKRFFVVLLACFLVCYPVFATEVTNDTGYDSELPDVPVTEETTEETAVSPAEDVPVSPVEEVPVSDDLAQPDIVPDVLADSDNLVPPESGENVDGDVSETLSAASGSPVPVTVVEPDTVYQAVSPTSNPSPVDVVDSPPDNPPFYGSGYITGTTSNGSTVTLYFPINYKQGYFGTDSNGYLFNVSSNSISGYFDSAYNNSVSVSGFSYPRYRTSSQSYDYTTLYIRPTASNMQIATQTAPVVSVNDIMPYVSILLLGVIFLCCMRKS